MAQREVQRQELLRVIEAGLLSSEFIRALVPSLLLNPEAFSKLL